MIDEFGNYNILTQNTELKDDGLYSAEGKIGEVKFKQKDNLAPELLYKDKSFFLVKIDGSLESISLFNEVSNSNEIALVKEGDKYTIYSLFQSNSIFKMPFTSVIKDGMNILGFVNHNNILYFVYKNNMFQMSPEKLKPDNNLSIKVKFKGRIIAALMVSSAEYVKITSNEGILSANVCDLLINPDKLFIKE